MENILGTYGKHPWKLLNSANKKLLNSANKKLLNSASGNLRTSELVSFPTPPLDYFGNLPIAHRTTVASRAGESLQACL